MIISCKVTFIECYSSRSLFDVFLPSLYPDKVVVVVMYSDITAETLPLSQSEEVQITEKLELLLGEKGIVLWWRGRPRQTTGWQ